MEEGLAAAAVAADAVVVEVAPIAKVKKDRFGRKQSTGAAPFPWVLPLLAPDCGSFHARQVAHAMLPMPSCTVRCRQPCSQ